MNERLIFYLRNSSIRIGIGKIGGKYRVRSRTETDPTLNASGSILNNFDIDMYLTEASGKNVFM